MSRYADLLGPDEPYAMRGSEQRPDMTPPLRDQRVNFIAYWSAAASMPAVSK